MNLGIGIPNHTSGLIKDYLAGLPLYKEVCLKVVNSFDLIYTSDTRTYDDLVKEAKDILNRAKKSDFSDVIFIQTEEEIEIKIMVVIVRLLNLTHKGKYFIVLNDGILYCPEDFQNHSLEEIKNHLTQARHVEYRNRKILEAKQKFKQVKKFISYSWWFALKINVNHIQ